DLRANRRRSRVGVSWMAAGSDIFTEGNEGNEDGGASSNALRAWKPAIRQTWNSALLWLRLRRCVPSVVRLKNFKKSLPCICAFDKPGGPKKIKRTTDGANRTDKQKPAAEENSQKISVLSVKSVVPKMRKEC